MPKPHPCYPFLCPAVVTEIFYTNITKTKILGVRYHSTPTILCGCMPGVASLGFKIALHSHKAGFWAKIQKIGNVHSPLLILTICCSPILAVNTQEIDAHRSLEKIRKAEDHLKKCIGSKPKKTSDRQEL